MGAIGGRGLDFLNKLREERGFSTDGEARTYMKQIWLGDDNDIAIWWFLTDGNDIYFGPFHEEPRQSRAGKSFKADILCDGEGCKRCVAAQDDPKLRPWIKGISLVYVEQVEHSVPDPKGEWKAKKRGNLTWYVEPIHETRIWIVKSQMQQTVMNIFGERTTLTDGYYEYRRYGARKSSRVNYTLTRTDPFVEKMSAGCTEAAAAGLDIDEVVQQNFTDQRTPAKTVEGVSADDPFGGEGAANPTSVPVEDDADELGFD